MRPSAVLLDRLLPAALALLGLGALGPCRPVFATAPAALITLDPADPQQTIDGLGGSAADESALRAMPEPDRSQVMDLVFGDLEPSVVRLKIRPAVEPSNDDGDPAHVTPSGFVAPDDSLWQLGEIFGRGAPRLMGAMWTPPAWMKTTGQECCGGTLLPGMDAELAELFSVYLGFFEQAGHPLDWLSIQNEPESPSPWDANTYTPESYASTAEVVAQRLVQDGHAIRLVAPDTALSIFVQIYLPFLLAEPTAAGLLDAVAFHHYVQGYYEIDRVAPAMQDLRAQVPAALPLWMTEFSNTTGVGYGTWDEAFAQAELIHETLANGGSMYLIWNLYRPGGPGEALVVIPTAPGVGGYQVTPKYWTARQYLKFVRPGARRIAASSADPDVLVTAYRDEAAGRLVAVLLNRGAEARWAVFQGVEPAGLPRIVRSSPAAYGEELAPESVERFGPRALLLPPRSVVTAVWSEPGPAPR